MGKIANMYLDWNIMVVNGHRMVDELVARRAIDIAKKESELQQDVVRGDAPSVSVELCGLLWDTENLTIGGYEKDGHHYYSWQEAMDAARSVGKRLPTRYEWEELCDLGSTWDDKRKGRWFGGNHDSDHKGSLFLPAAGWHNTNSGELVNTNSCGFYWSSSPYFYDDNLTVNLYLDLRGAETIQSYHAFGLNVRCIWDK